MSAFIPKKTKFRKAQRGHMSGLSVAGSRVNFGEFGLKALECGSLTHTQIEMIRVTLARSFRRTGRFWIRIFADKPVTKKPQEVRMGKGKGDLDHWEAIIRRGRVIFEIGGVPKEYAQGVFKKIAYKLPFNVKLIERI
jgi:large subunit ribosomal protein L16